jgi:bifunctional ADP-heptose synthase (sugar kinase/adenylyltransferase)
VNYAELLPLVEQLANRRAVVIGDVILDEYLVGRAERLSREAPIPVLEFERREMIPGGAANPSATVASLGSRAVQIGVVGQDDAAAHLHHALHAQGDAPDDHQDPRSGADGAAFSATGGPH